MRVTKLTDYDIEVSGLDAENWILLKWGDEENPNLDGLDARDIEMENVVAIPKSQMEQVLQQNPDCRISRLLR